MRFKLPFSTALAVSLIWSLHPVAAEPSLAEATALIMAKPKVDLTHAFGPATPVWSGFGQAKMTPAVDPHTLEAYTIAKDGFRATYYAMVGQYGTHVDPPAHASATGRTMDEIPIDEMILPLVVLDATPYLAADPAHAFSLADLEAWEKANGPVPKGSFVALRTDISKDWDRDPDFFKREAFPGWSLPVLKTLFEQRGVVAIGHEAMDTDTTKSMESETYLLGAGHYQIEVMANLEGAGDRRDHRRDLAEGEERAGLSGPRLRDPSMSGPPSFSMLTTTVADRAEADHLARALVDARLAACVQLVPIASVYRWNDAVETGAEILLLAKIRAEDFAEVEAAIRRLHDYDVPEIVAVPIVHGSSTYLDWIAASTVR